jgi:hypothetical protein
MKFVIFKGIEGFSDRIQCMLYIISYAKYTNRTIVLDWTDNEWCHNKFEDFDHYFYLENINHYSLNELRNYLNNKTFTVIPTIWKKDIFKKPNNFVYSNNYLFNTENKIFFNIIKNNKPDFKEDIVIYSGVKFREYNYNLFYKHFRFKNFVFNFIKNKHFYKNVIFKKKKYDVLHLRGGDRFNCKECIDLNDEGIKKINNYVNNLLEKIKTKPITENNLLVISDTDYMLSYGKELLKNYNYNLYFTENYKQNKNQGLHKINKNNLKISKEQLNLEMITDFFFLTKATNVINDNKSLFSNMSKNLNFYEK